VEECSPSAAHGANPGFCAPQVICRSSRPDGSATNSQLSTHNRLSGTHRITIPGTAEFAADLAELKDLCRWTHGHWDFGPHAQRKWNELQNTPKGIQRLTNYLLFEYKARVWSRPLVQRREA
jgi:hypothetical protein